MDSSAQALPSSDRTGSGRRSSLELDGSPSPPQLYQLNQRRRWRQTAADAKLDEFGHVDMPAPRLAPGDTPLALPTWPVALWD